jgi:4-amino-4-deoxy-L-arabinose transferase-like glycosyltransferase
MSGDARDLDPLTRTLALASAVLVAWLYLGRLDGTPLQRGNEAMYASPPIQMLATGDYLVPRWENRPFLDKPPLTFWILSASYRLLGVSVSSARLPGALAGLATALLVGWWVSRRKGRRAGILAAFALAFSFQFAMTSLTFAADIGLTLAVTMAILALDAACRRTDGSDAARGILAGAALALAFYAKGLVGIALPVGAVAAGLLIDRSKPVRLASRCAWMLCALLALVTPWHAAMNRRLGPEFWRVFYWENQFLRGATPKFMQMSRGPFYYLGTLAWGIFPWSFLLPGVLWRRKASGVFLGWFAFGIVFWSLLVMKREVYVVTILPAVAALVGEGVEDPVGAAPARGWRRIPWILAAAIPCAGLILLARAYPRLTELADSRSAVLWLAAGLLALSAALAAAGTAPESPRRPLAVALACGLLLLALQNLDTRLGRWDPLPAWGSRLSAECARGCDGFLYANNFNSIAFYSRFDWVMVGDPARLPERLSQRQGFVVMWSSLEPRLAGLPLKWEVVERRPTFRGALVPTALGFGGVGLDSLSLVRIERP